MLSNYGFNFNTSAVTDKDGKISIGVNFEDSNGFKFDTQEEGTVEEVSDALYQKFLTKYLVDSVRRCQEEEKTKEIDAATENDKASPEADDNLIKRLRKLEQENAKYKEMLDKQKDSLSDEEKAKAQAASDKYKDKKYAAKKAAVSKQPARKKSTYADLMHKTFPGIPASTLDFAENLFNGRKRLMDDFEDFWWF